MKRLQRQLEAKCEEVNTSLKLHAQAQDAHNRSIGDMQTQRDLLAADVARLTTATAEKDRALAALTEEKFQLQAALQRASEQRMDVEGKLHLLGEELQRGKAQAETLNALVMEKEASIGSLTNERYNHMAQIEAERAARRAKQDELDGAKAQLTQAQTDLATLSTQHAQTRTELESFKAHSGTSMQEKMEEICRVQKQLHTMQLTLDQAELLASSTGRDAVRAIG